MVFAATSWHWLDPGVRYAKAAALLRPQGVLVFTTGGHAFPPGFDTFFTEIQSCYQAIGEGSLTWPPPMPDEIPDARGEIDRSGYFHNVRVVRRIWIEDFTGDEYVALMNTASDHRLMEPGKRERLFAEMRRLIDARPGGRVRKHNLTVLHVARRNS
jgi:SAM-dependent methyltransferase